METTKRKHAVVLLAGKNEFGRAFHAMVYAKDLHEHGHEARLFFDGAGTEWLERIAGGEDGLRPLFDHLQEESVVGAACSSCTRTFNTSDAAKALEVQLTGEETHVRVGELARDGYEVWVV